MALKPNFNNSTVRRLLTKGVENIETAILNNLSYLGEMAIRECRDNANFQDQTGNLRSSMGYLIVKDGKVLTRGGFQQNAATIRIYNEQGADEGERLALQLSEQTKDTYTLIVVAGMNYAVYVESKSFNVLSSAEILVEKEFPKMMRNLEKSINRNAK